MDLFLITALSIVVILGLGTSYLVWLLFHKIQAGLALIMLLFVWETVAAALRLAITNEFHAGRKAWPAFSFFLFASVFMGPVRLGTSAGVRLREFFGLDRRVSECIRLYQAAINS